MNHRGEEQPEAPRAEARSFTDDGGRRWSGVVMSGPYAGGARHAEVVFVCEDTPGEAKRSTRLDGPQEEAAAQWRSMPEEEMRALLRESDPV
ncbi:MAG TPA: hypothetical protein VFZ24_16770 [Longimicrobiales bacterium]